MLKQIVVSWESKCTFNILSTKLIQIDIDSNEIGRNNPVEMGVIADLNQAISILNRVGKDMIPNGIINEEIKQEIKKTIRVNSRPEIKK